jgi:zinc protease
MTAYRWGRGLVAGLLLFVVWSAQAALQLSDPVPVGPQVVKGQLPNGLTYYIQKNARPEKRLELRLVVKAGSVLEDEDQQGLAHFVEHMAFNGSTNFQKNELISYLQSIGLKFGADLNAYTGFNETVYLLPIPTDNRENVEKAFLVLQDWAQGVLFNPADIDSERAIVLEELRSGKGFQDRVNRVLLPKILQGTAYANRLPIGTETSLKTFSHAAIKRFYKDWYRPNLMAVVVVGDMEPADAQRLVEKHFGALVNPKVQRKRDYPRLTQRKVSEALVITDKEAPNAMVQMLYPVVPDLPVRTLAEERQRLIEGLFGQMLALRMQELTQQAAPPFVGGGSSLGSLVPGYKVFGSTAVLGKRGEGPALDALVQENERARLYGFGAQELERAKKNLLRGAQQAHAEREKTNSATFAAEYIRNFLEQESIPGVANELLYAQELLPTIALADVNRYAQQVIPAKAAKLVTYIGPEKSEAATPGQAQLLSEVQEAQRRPVQARVEKAVAATLMRQTPRAGSIVGERQVASLGLTELDLSNGIKVILKPTDFKNDQIVLGASRFGGQSLFAQADMYNAQYAGVIAASMGLGEFTPVELQRMMAGKVVSASTWMGTWTDGVSGTSSPADLEALLQMVALKFGPVRKDAALFQSYVTRSQDASRNALANPQARFQDALQTALYAGHPRLPLTPRPEHFAGIALERVTDIYQERFASAKGMTFVLVGSFDVEQVKPLLRTYLASLPTPDIAVAYKDLGMRPVKGVLKKEVRAGTEPKSTVSITFTGEASVSPAEEMRLRAMVEVMNIKIIEELREKLTLIYGGGMGGGLSKEPYPNYRIALTLPTGPENVDKVIAAALGEIQKLQQDGPLAADLEKVKQNWRVAHRRDLRENTYWLGKIQKDALYQTDPALVLDYEKRVDALTAAEVQEAARKYLRLDNYLQMVLQPQSE